MQVMRKPGQVRNMLLETGGQETAFLTMGTAFFHRPKAEPRGEARPCTCGFPRVKGRCALRVTGQLVRCLRDRESLFHLEFIFLVLEMGTNSFIFWDVI